MPQGILSFDLPMERDDFELAQKGWAYKCAWSEFWNYLRQKSKYEDKDSLTIEEIRERLVELQDEFEIDRD